MTSLVFLCLLALAWGSPLAKLSGKRSLSKDFEFQEYFQLELDENGQCIYVKSEEGVYVFTSPGVKQVCGLYIITDPDKQVEFEFQAFDISCTKGGLLSVIDGWELNGQFFPSPEDHPLSTEKRYREFCSKTKPRKSFISSQNVGLIEFRIPTKGQGFRVSVKFINNPKPCNAVLQDPQGVYTLRNYNRKSNCSISVIFPLSISILASSIGMQSSWPPQNFDVETGLVSKCHKRGLNDFVEVRGGDGLDPAQMNVVADYCGLQSIPSSKAMTVVCGNTAVRLVSSGRYENSITFSFDLPTDFSSPDFICPSLLESF